MNWRILHGEVRDQLRTLAPESVQTCVTSPPYFGLRDYGADGQIGLEATSNDYIAALVKVFDEVWRVLRADGTLWLNVGDSYVSNGRYESDRSTFVGTLSKYSERDPRVGARVMGLKPKDLMMIPARVAMALQAEGWYLRSDIIWSKPNPMPESVTDRPTKSHEYIFMLTKAARYYYDADAIREHYEMSSWTAESDAAGVTARGALGAWSGDKTSDRAVEADGVVEERHRRMGRTSMLNAYGNGGRNKRSVWHVATQPFPDAHFATFPEALIEPCILAGSRVGDTVLDPFCGSGTTGAVAINHQRNFVGVELNAAYVELARRRIGNVSPLFSREGTAPDEAQDSASLTA